MPISGLGQQPPPKSIWVLTHKVLTHRTPVPAWVPAALRGGRPGTARRYSSVPGQSVTPTMATAGRQLALACRHTATAGKSPLELAVVERSSSKRNTSSKTEPEYEREATFKQKPCITPAWSELTLVLVAPCQHCEFSRKVSPGSASPGKVPWLLWRSPRVMATSADPRKSGG